MTWLPDRLPDRFDVGALRFIPLTPRLVNEDFAAVMRDPSLLRAWSASDWPTNDFTVDDDLSDLEWHEREQLEGIALTYSVLIDNVIEGCIYVRSFRDALATRELEPPTPLPHGADGAVARGWLHRLPAAELVAATFDFLSTVPFDFPSLWWQTNSDCPDQITACDALGLTREVALPTERTTWLLRCAP